MAKILVAVGVAVGVGVVVGVIGGNMFYVEKSGDWVSLSDNIETALESARYHGAGSEVRRVSDGVLLGRVGKTADLLKAIRAEAA